MALSGITRCAWPFLFVILFLMKCFVLGPPLLLSVLYCVISVLYLCVLYKCVISVLKLGQVYTWPSSLA